MTQINTYIHLCERIWGEGKREREIYIYMYTEREKEREKYAKRSDVTAERKR